jgi:lysyl oxidase
MTIHRAGRRALRSAALTCAVVLTASVTAASGTAVGLAASRAPARVSDIAAPVLKLRASQKSLTTFVFRKQVFLDPGVFVESLGAPLEFQVQRSSFTTPLQISQVLSSQAGTQLRQLPPSVLDGWFGLRHFFRLTFRNKAGKVAASKLLTFCPNVFGPQRARPSGPTASPFPQQCASDPFQQGMVWGVQKNWAVDPFDVGFGFGIGVTPTPVFKLAAGTYHLTMSVTPRYRRLFAIAGRDASAKITVHVKKPPRCCHRGRRAQMALRPLAKDPAAPSLRNPPVSALPDLMPLPSWGIRVSHLKKQQRDLLDFGATVWVGGHARLDVQGFRSGNGPGMKAYQYFWRNGKLIGRARAGTMGFDSHKGHHHWHFQQFAAYRLLNASKKLMLRSHKQGFCIAPTDPVNLLLHNTTWKPSEIGLEGACGSPSALWVREMMPIGWGDTYFQSVAGQSFDVTHLPNGTYYIEVLANPERVLRETSTANDVSLRKVILGGTRGHRTVRVPAFHGIDPEK